jgi:hypothetical protein
MNAAVAATPGEGGRARRTWLVLILASALCPLAVLASGPIAFGIYMANDFGDDEPSNMGNAYLWILASFLLVTLAGVVAGWTLHGLRKFTVAAFIAGVVSACAAGLVVLLFTAELVSVAA